MLRQMMIGACAALALVSTVIVPAAAQDFPTRPISRASVFDQPTSDRRSVFERPRLGMGDATPDEVEVTMRPQRRSRIDGNR